MLSKKNTKEQLKKQEAKKQRFAIKKLTVGVASVLIGFTFLGVSGVTTANADSSTSTSDSSTTTTPTSSTSTTSESTDSATPASSNTAAVSVTPIAGTPSTSTSPAAGNSDSSTSSSTSSDQSTANTITADAIADGYIKSTTDATNAKNTLSGRAWIVTTGTPSTMSNGLQALPDGTQVYLKWMDTDGSVSPTYVASIKAIDSSDGSQVGPGAYAFDLRDGWTDANGKLHKYNAVAGQYYKLWIPDIQAADGNTITMMRQVSGYYPGSWVNSVTSKNLGQFPLIGTNMQRTGIFMYEIPAGAVDGGASYMTTAKDQWIEDAAGPLSAPAVSGDKDASGTISGRVWPETGGDIANSATGPNYNSLMGDTAANGYTVIASMLTPEGVKAYKDQIESLSVSEQAAAAKELLTAHPEYIAATVYGKTNENGQYTLRFPKDITWENTYVYMTVLDSNDQLATTYSAYTMPVFRSPNANNSWLPQTSPAYNAIATGSPSWYNVNFAIVNNTMVTLDITNFNSTDKPAYYGDTATIKLDAKGSEISPLSNYIQWTDTNGNNVGDPVPVTLLSDGTKANLTIGEDGKTVTINGVTYDLKNQVKTGDVFTATLYEGNDSNPVAKDSFVVKAQDKDLYEPAYEKETVSAGQKATVTPTFTDANGETVAMPEGTTFAVDSSSSAAAAGWSTLDPATGEITYSPDAAQAAGDYYIPVTVTYPDGTSEVVNAQVTVSNEADEYTATGGELTKPYGEATTADDVISKVTTDYPTTDDQPTIAVADPSTLPDGKTAGTYEVPVTVTYPDGTTDKTTVTVTVLDQIIDQTKNPDAPTPEGYVRVTFEAGDHGSFSDGASTIFDVREGTAFSDMTLPTVVANSGYQQKSGTDAWSPALPTTVDATGTYTAQYEESATDADKYTPTGQDLTTEQGQEPSASDGITNKDDLPAGTEYTWKDTPDVSTPGTKPGTIIVTYPDGSKDEVTVNVTVTAPTPTETDADKNTPEPQPIDTPKGVVPNPGDGVANKGDLPDGTDYTWADPDKVNQDVNTPGTYDETVIVTYPDGSQDVIVVRVTVTEPADSGNQTGNAGTDSNNNNANVSTGSKTTVTTGTNNQAKTSTLPQTGNDNSAAVVGLGMVSLAAMFGLGWLKKKD